MIYPAPLQSTPAALRVAVAARPSTHADPGLHAAVPDDHDRTATAAGKNVDREKGLMTAWKPIGTAPKDRKFLGFLQTRLAAEIEICVWSSADRIFMPDYCLYNPHLWHLDVETRGVRITDWMPLPAYLDRI